MGDGRGGVNTTITPSLDRERIGNTSIEKWCVVKKGASIIVDGKNWWCLKHVDKATPYRWNGMYIIHKPEDHDEVMAKRYRDKKSTTAAQTVAQEADLPMAIA